MYTTFWFVSLHPTLWLRFTLFACLTFQDLIVLFSETLMRAIKEELVTQDSVDFCDPSLMFAIPRLAIVYGLLVCNKEGPLNVDRSSAEFPALFLPFKNLLRYENLSFFQK